MELWENANKGLENLLATKTCMEAHRWRVMWELGVEFHQNESQAAESIKEAKAIHSWVTLDAKTACSAVIKEAKTTWKLYHLRGQSYLLYSHQRCWGLEGLPGRVTPRETWQHHAGSGYTIHPRGEQKSNWLPLYLPGHSVCQPNGAQEHSGCFLPHFIGANASNTSICLIAKGFPSGRTAHFSCSSLTSAQAVS